MEKAFGMNIVRGPGDKIMEFKDYSLQPFDKSDIEGVADLQKFLWGPNTDDNVQHMKWKYFDNPFSKDPIAFTAKKNETIVGFIGVMPTRWRIGESIMEFLSFGDGCIHPEHRRKGLYPKLLQGLFDHVQGSNHHGFLNLSNNATTTHVVEKMGFASLREITFFKRVNYFNFLRNTLIEPGHREYRSGNVKFSLTPDIDEMLKYDEKMKNSGKVHLFKDISFYRWRFGSKRRQYHFFYHYSDGELAAYMVLFVNSKGSARIIDHAYDDPKNIMEIIEKIIRKNNYGIVLLMDTGIDDDLQLVLRKYGVVKDHFYDSFRRDKSVCQISYKPLEYSGWNDIKSIDRSDLEDISKWDIKEIASDGV